MGSRFCAATLIALFVAAAFPAVHAAGLRLRGGSGTVVYSGSRDVARMNTLVPTSDDQAEQLADTASLQLTGVPQDVVLRLKVKLPPLSTGDGRVAFSDLKVLLTAHPPCTNCSTFADAGVPPPFDQVALDEFDAPVLAGAPALPTAWSGSPYGDGAEFSLEAAELAKVQANARSFGLMAGLRFGLTVDVPSPPFDRDQEIASLKVIALYPPDNPSAARHGFILQHEEGGLSDWILSGNRFIEHTSLAGVPPSWRLIGSGDIDRDGDADLFWQEQTQGWVAVWRMNGNRMEAGDYVEPYRRVPDRRWNLKAVGDLDGDGFADLVWQSTTIIGGRSLIVWFLRGGTVREDRVMQPAHIDSNWHIVGAGDVNGDGRDDLFWQHQLDGRVAVWYMREHVQQSGDLLTPGQVPREWKLRAVKDLNGDRRPDLVFQNETTGAFIRWLMNGSTRIDEALLTPNDVGDPRWRLGAMR